MVKLGDELVMLGDKLVNLVEIIIVVVKLVMLGARTPRSARDSRTGIAGSARQGRLLERGHVLFFVLSFLVDHRARQARCKLPLCARKERERERVVETENRRRVWIAWAEGRSKGRLCARCLETS